MTGRWLVVGAAALAASAAAGCSHGGGTTVVVVTSNAQGGTAAPAPVVKKDDLCAAFTTAHAKVKDAYGKFDAATQGSDWTWKDGDAASTGDDLAQALRQESSDVRAFIAKQADGATADQLRSLPDRADRLAKDVEQRGDPDLVASEKKAYWAAAKHADAICASAAAN